VNPYERLGITPDASAAEIRAAYRRLAQEVHPDHGRASLDEMALLNDAYVILRDPDRRAAYDRTLRAVDTSAGRPSSDENTVAPLDVADDWASLRRLRLLVVAAVAISAVVMLVLVLVAFVEGY
jgi:curved DNA-binding protein CbpA